MLVNILRACHCNLYVCYQWFVLQAFAELIETIAEGLAPVVNGDPYVLAFDIAKFERELSLVSVLPL